MIRDLKGKSVPIETLGSSKHVLLSSMLAYIGLDPRKDINWVPLSLEDGMKLFVDGKADAFLGFPPEPQELRARKIGHVIVNTVTDKPWSQYYCCTLISHREFVQKYPVATKKVLRSSRLSIAKMRPDRICLRSHGLWRFRSIARAAAKQRFNRGLGIVGTSGTRRRQPWNECPATRILRRAQFSAARLASSGCDG